MKTTEQTQKAEGLVKLGQDYVDLSKVSRKLRTYSAKEVVDNTLDDIAKSINKMTEGL